MLENHPLDWLALFGLDPGHGVKVINSDLSTVTAEADKVLWIDAHEPWIVHVEVQSSYQAELPLRLLRYNVLLNVRHEVPVHSVIVLLFPEADGRAISGRYEQASPDGRCRIAFDYQVVRVWQESPETLAAGLGTIPLAALAVPSREDLPTLIERMKKAEFARHPTRDEGEIWVSLYLLIGGHFHDKQLANKLLKGIQTMRDSVTYQAILDEGREEGRQEGQIQLAHKTLLRLGTRRFHEPTEEIRLRIEALTNLEKLQNLLDRVIEVQSWEELFADSSA